MKLKSFALCTALVLLSAGFGNSVKAQTCKDDFKRNPDLAASNYVAYPGPKASLTPAPKGYEPVYLSHYGRHGSRYHIGSVYGNVYGLLQHADSADVLTEKGKTLMRQVKMLKDEAAGRDGELTELGAQQHRQIAERMYLNFPEIFGKKTRIDAKSTIIIRCILSMENALLQLKGMNPQLDIHHDASNHDMYYMNQNADDLYKYKKAAMDSVGTAFSDAHTHPERLMAQLFSSETYWKDSIDAKNLMQNIHKLAMNVQSSEIRHNLSLTDYFTQEEIYDLWQTKNVFWYLTYGPSSYSGGLQPYSQRNLLRNIINEADSCLALDNCGATLRYGHDTMVMPLTCLLELDDTNRDILNLSTLAEQEWCDYRIFPMACNLQFVFYRSKGAKAGTADKDSRGKDILVKVLRNENEARLPVATDTWPYYKWSDVKAYYTKKLEAFKDVKF
ncbi:MAG: histidine phosphatase family protein [Bacteroidales bacterium]|nr:histidine phosphatase family protein [Bacteroidales bacterium]MCM1146302.1 histidine phosphatase family protein [Bacteroidales bacterium]MCM1205260.1 histidine phosphatase family protein [Bacillota bacterium]MCM1509655.1 histidine phosphatase family protein [Clostridium sp.]